MNIAALSNGIAAGWPSPMIPLLRGQDNPVGDTPMSEKGASWIGGLLCLGGLSLVPFTGALAEKIGRKRFGYLIGIPMMGSWLLTIFATSHEYVYVARFVSGMAGAMIIFLVPLYVSEIASEDIRGALGSLLVFSINIGILLAFVGGSFMSYTIFTLSAMMISIAYLVAFIFVPETPFYLMKQNRVAEAAR